MPETPRPPDEELDELLAAEEEGALSPERAARLAALVAGDPARARARILHVLDGRILCALTAPAFDAERAVGDLMTRIETLAAATPSGELATRTAARLVRRRRSRGGRRAVLCLGAAAAVALYVLLGPPAAPVDARATVAAVDGEAEVVSGDRTGRLLPGRVLAPGEGLRTGPCGAAELRYADGSVVRVRGDAEVVLPGDAAGLRLDVARGALLADVAPQRAGRRAVLTTPHARVTVIGTRLALSVGPAATRVEVGEGLVLLQRPGDGTTVEVPAGSCCVAGPGAAPAAHPVARADDWPTVGGTPGRTGRSAAGPAGPFTMVWVRRFPDRVWASAQPVVAGGALYLSTSRGVWAMDARTGQTRWRHDLARPPGHAPAVAGGILYVGGHDAAVRALEAATGRELWSFAGGAAFTTTPLVVDGAVFVGCEDGHEYALDAWTGGLLWKFAAGAPVTYSSSYGGRTVYFGARDGHAFAVGASDGRLRWKSARLPGHGLDTYYPVVAGDRVVYCTGVQSWTTALPGLPGPGGTRMAAYFLRFHGHAEGGTYFLGAPLDAGHFAADRVADYYREYPSRRTVVLLDAGTGAEREVAPFPTAWPEAGTCHPPAVGDDGTLYLYATVAADARELERRGGCRAAVCGWKPGSDRLSAGPQLPGDEPVTAAVAGGRLLWTRGENRDAGCAELEAPADPARAWRIGMGGGPGGRIPMLPVDEEGIAAARRAFPGLRVHWDEGLVHWGGPADSIPPVAAGGMVYVVTARYGVIAGFAGRAEGAAE